MSYTNNNFNINFNNVFFCSQRISSGANDNINCNSENNTKSNPNNNKNLTHNNNISNNINSNTMNKVNNNIYINNLKSIYNISRNKINIKGSSLTQNQTGNKAQSQNKDTKDNNNFYNLNNNYNIPSNHKKYIIKEKDINDKKASAIFEESKPILINLANKNDKISKLNFKDNQKRTKNLNKNIHSNKISIRGNSNKNIKVCNKHSNLTSKNNSKSKHKKRISNFI